jgi:hypothetical protein
LLRERPGRQGERGREPDARSRPAKEELAPPERLSFHGMRFELSLFRRRLDEMRDLMTAGHHGRRDPALGIDEERTRGTVDAVAPPQLVALDNENVFPAVLIRMTGTPRVGVLEHGNRQAVGLALLPPNDVRREVDARAACGVREDEQHR